MSKFASNLTQFTTHFRLRALRPRPPAGSLLGWGTFQSKKRISDWPYLYSDKRIMAPQLDSYFKQVDDLAESFIERLRKAVAIPSVSSEDERRPDVVKVSPLNHALSASGYAPR